MSAFRSVQALMTTLSRHRSLIHHLFLNRMGETTMEMVLTLANGDERVIQSLVAKNILVRDGETIFLDERILSFLEDFLEVNEEVQNYKIDERITLLKSNMDYYQNEKNIRQREEYLHKIKQNLHGLGKIVRRNVIDLGKQIQHDYKTETNFTNKILKIEQHNTKSERLTQLVAIIEGILANEAFFLSANDELLRKYRIELKYDLRDTKVNLIELHQEIVNCLNRVENQVQVFKKLQAIKRLKDHYELEKKTNVKEIFEANRDLFFQNRQTFPTRPSLEWLQTDPGYDVIGKLVKKRKHKTTQKAILEAHTLKAGQVNTQPVQEKRINYAQVKRRFFESSHNLFDFIWQYPFDPSLNAEERVQLFCKVALLYEDEMHFTAENKDVYSKELGQKIRYAVILPLQSEIK